MLGRRHLRIKVLQSLYAFFQSGDDRLDIAEKGLLRSLDKLYEIYIYQLSFLIELVRFSEKKMNEAKNKYYPTEQEMNPNTRFIQNRLIAQLASNQHLLKQIQKFRISWHDQEELLKQTLIKIKESTVYQEYMEAGEDSFGNDQDFLIKLVKRKFSKLENLHFYYEEKNIFWSDDYNVANHLVIKTITALEETDDEFLPLPELLETPANKFDESDLDFIKLLFRKVIIRDQELETLIRDKLKNWELERLAIMDIIILKMAIVELMDCHSIPVKVTLNEYIEIAKLYSTPKSSFFINGILDKLISDLKSEKKIKKVGIGLIDN
ncbi:MAG: transcription antitermination factor NusB [Bacteroidales bacterium]|nr:transcription antitermination factor NusB [Bacteroidales bacterium]